MLRSFTLAALLLVSATGQLVAADGDLKIEELFPREQKHNHASCIVERPDGSLLVTWYRGTGERRADDVVITAARLAQGAKSWGKMFVMTDTPGYPDMNPATFSAPDGSLWMIWPVVLDHRWEGALLKFLNAKEDNGPGAPKWTNHGVMHITPGANFGKEIHRGIAALKNENVKVDETEVKSIEARADDLLYQRLGWMPRVHPTVLPSGRWVWPLYCDTFSVSIMALSDDQGKTWRASGPLIGFGNIQPSVVRKNDGTLVAYMRDNGPHRKIRVSTSKDQGETWSDAVDSTLPNPGAGIEAIRLVNGHWAMIYNDLSKGRHSLAISISTDEGATWKATRHVEKHEAGQGSYHYPSIIQTRDGLIHLSYTSGGHKDGSTIAHASFSEDWVLKGD
jgi:predicted neuraminidase